MTHLKIRFTFSSIAILLSLLSLSSCSTGHKRGQADPATVDIGGYPDKRVDAKGPQEEEKPGEVDQSQFEAPTRKPKIALVLGPGGARGFAHLGVIKELEAAGLNPDIITGTEFGAVVGSIYANSGSANRLEWQLFKLSEDSFFDFPLLSLKKKEAPGEQVYQYLRQNFGKKRLKDFELAFATNAISKNERRLYYFKRGHAAGVVRASLGIPGWISPVKLGGKTWLSGATQDPLPVKLAKQMGAEFIIAVDVISDFRALESDNLDPTFVGLLGAMRALSRESLREADFVIRPKLPDIGMKDFSQRAEIVDKGRLATQDAVNELSDKIANWSVEKNQANEEETK